MLKRLLDESQVVMPRFCQFVFRMLVALAGVAALSSAAIASSPSKYPIEQPEYRLSDNYTEADPDIVIVSQLENRLYLYHYLHLPDGKTRLDFRSQPMVMPIESYWAEGRVVVDVRSPSYWEAMPWYWVGYFISDDVRREYPAFDPPFSEDDPRRAGFMVDEIGNVASVVLDNDDKPALAVITSAVPWNDERKAKALATLSAKLNIGYPNPKFEGEVRFERHEPVKNRTAEFLALHKKARAISNQRTPEFRSALSELRRFVLEQDARRIDPDNKNSMVVTALNDYGDWIGLWGDGREADNILTDVLRRSPSRLPVLLNRADARWKLGGKFQNDRYDGDYWRNHFKTLAREDYRQYCLRQLANKKTIRGNTAKRIMTALEVPALNAQTCRLQTRIFQAIEAGNLEAVRAELASGQDPNVKNDKGLSALEVAANEKKLEIIRALVAAGARADVETETTDRGYPLLARVMANREKISDEQYHALLDALLEAGASVDAILNGRPLLSLAVATQDRDAFNYLLDHGANPDMRDAGKMEETVFFVAMNRPRTLWFAERLLERGADINGAHITSYYGNDPCWKTALGDTVFAIRSDEPTLSLARERIQFLLDHGADPTLGGCGGTDQIPPHLGMEEATEWLTRLEKEKSLTAEIRAEVEEKLKQAALKYESHKSP
ncbi:MAG: ankyrin repeat domain-containing protein [Gallionellaceae bacterium]|jgi:ankyrin repeat protein|nr:ankyrin repeat domain-containing protein [Gallionellaceae bacterium]